MGLSRFGIQNVDAIQVIVAMNGNDFGVANDLDVADGGNPIGQIVQNEIRLHRLGIDVEHLIQPIAVGDALRQRQPIQHDATLFVRAAPTCRDGLRSRQESNP